MPPTFLSSSERLPPTAVAVGDCATAVFSELSRLGISVAAHKYSEDLEDEPVGMGTDTAGQAVPRGTSKQWLGTVADRLVPNVTEVAPVNVRIRE